MWIKHQRLVRTLVEHVDERADEVEPAMGIQPHVEHLGRRAANGGCPQRKTARHDLGRRHLVLRDDDDGGLAKGIAGILVDSRLDPTRRHQSDMNPVMHAVRLHCLPDRIHEAIARQAELKPDLRSALQQAIDMRIQEHKSPLVKTQAFPDTVTQDKSGIEDRNPGLRTRHQGTVQVDQDICISWIGREILAARHAVPLMFDALP